MHYSSEFLERPDELREAHRANRLLSQGTRSRRKAGKCWCVWNACNLIDFDWEILSLNDAVNDLLLIDCTD